MNIFLDFSIKKRVSCYLLICIFQQITYKYIKVLQDRGIVRSTKFIDLLTLPLGLTEIGPKVKVSVNGTKALRATNQRKYLPYFRK